MSASLRKQLAQFGFIPVRQLKRDRVVLARRSDSPDFVIVKVTPQDDKIQAYASMLEVFHRRKDEFKILAVPDYLGRFDRFDVFSYLPGVSINWSEEASDPGFGGEGIPVELAQDVLDVSEDLDRLGYWNGDFYWRNFVFLTNGRLGIIDWDNIIVSDRGSESRVAYIFCLAFRNAELRDTLAGGAMARGLIKEKTFRRKVIKTSENFMEKWRGKDEVIKSLDEIHHEFTDTEHFMRLWKKFGSISQ